jgi:hypothetical protein
MDKWYMAARMRYLRTWKENAIAPYMSDTKSQPPIWFYAYQKTLWLLNPWSACYGWQSNIHPWIELDETGSWLQLHMKLIVFKGNPISIPTIGPGMDLWPEF